MADLDLDVEQPYAELAAKNAKSGRGARLPLRADLVEDLRANLVEELLAHLAEKLAQYRRQALKDGRAEVPMALPAGTKLFHVPQDLVGIFDRDLVAAGIKKTDVDGRTLDVHCLRHTFATLLAKAGVVPRMAQELMRHSDIRLTMNVYTHLQLVDTAGAVEALPSIGAVRRNPGRQLATGT